MTTVHATPKCVVDGKAIEGNAACAWKQHARRGICTRQASFMHGSRHLQDTGRNAADAEASAKAGALFGVSPGYTRTVGQACRDAGLALLPGVATGSEIMIKPKNQQRNKEDSKGTQWMPWH